MTRLVGRRAGPLRRAPLSRRALLGSALLWAGATGASCSRRAGGRGDGVLRVAAASSLAPAFDALGPELLARRTGAARVAIAYGASGTFARQLRAGAPFDVLALADAQMLRALARDGLIDPASVYAFGRGRLVLVSRADRAGGPVTRLEDLARDDVRRVAIANPETAPYGRAAREALTARGLLATLGARLVTAENVRQALEFALTGDADAALTARAALPTGQALAVTAVDPSLYAPIEQAVAVVRASHAPASARAFVDLLREPAGRAALAAHGFEPPPLVTAP